MRRMCTIHIIQQYQKSIKNQIPPECVKILLREKLRSLCSCTTKYVVLGTESCIKSEYWGKLLFSVS